MPATLRHACSAAPRIAGATRIDRRPGALRRVFGPVSWAVIWAVIRAVLWAVLLLLGWAAPAHADDVSATGRAVVRVVTIAVVDDEVVGFGHGSGFAVAPNRIVTNAHVVALAAKYPGNVVIGVVPSEGSKSYQGKIIAIDTARDLALIEFTGTRLPTVALFNGPVDEGGGVTALGYPGNVDLATARSAADYIHPLSPVRSQGVFSGRRKLEGVDVLLHTASIARGNSGGPLLDTCGRVLGVNSAITQGQEGDASFGFAIADSEVAAFLAAARQKYTAVGGPCTSIADIDRRDAEERAQAEAARDADRREAAGKAELARGAALVSARDDRVTLRENVMALAVLLLVFGAMAIGGGGLLDAQAMRREASWAVLAGVALMAGAVAVFVLRPTGEPKLADLPAAAKIVPEAPAVSSTAPLGKLACTFVAERSRVVASPTDDVALDWGKAGCMNGRTQYAENGSKWDRILVPAQEQTVSVLQFDPAAKSYVTARWFLTASQMDAVRKIRSQVTLKACSPDEAGRAQLATQQAAIRAALPPTPNEKIAYSCSAAP